MRRTSFISCAGVTEWRYYTSCTCNTDGWPSSQSHSLIAYSRAHLHLSLLFRVRATNATSMVTIETALVVRSNASPCACETLEPRSFFLYNKPHRLLQTGNRLTMYVVYVGVMHVGLVYVLHG